MTVYDNTNGGKIGELLSKLWDEIRTEPMLLSSCAEKDIQIQMINVMDRPEIFVMSADEEVSSVPVTVENADFRYKELCKVVYGEPDSYNQISYEVYAKAQEQKANEEAVIAQAEKFLRTFSQKTKFLSDSARVSLRKKFAEALS